MEEDRDELLVTTDDDESSSGNEDPCLPPAKVVENSGHNLVYQEHTQAELIITKILLITATLAVLILFPLYIETINVSGDVYSLFLTNTFLSTLFFILIAITLKFTFSKHKFSHILKLPLRLKGLIQISVIYFISAMLILYALDRKRVLCHLQDPLKGVTLLWSFLYYFIFCQRIMCLQQLFSITVVIIGAFIALDYDLCDQFKCRGFEREHIADDTGGWSWQSHLVWTLVYIGGMALFAAYLSTLEWFFIGATKTLQNNCVAPLLRTVSRSVSTSSTSTSTETETEETSDYKSINTIHLAMWLHIFGVIIAIFFFWTDFIPQIGRGSNATEVLNYTISGFQCHFSRKADCKNLPLISWLFLCFYVVLVTVSIHFLKLTQSAVYTVAVMATALPLSGIWWSLFPMTTLEKGLMVWKPSFSGELISSLLGLPVVIIGLYFLYKSHFKNYHCSKLLLSQPQTNVRIT